MAEPAPKRQGSGAGAEAPRDLAAVLAAVREHLREQAADALVLSSSDPHQSEYVSAHDSRLSFVAGFTGDHHPPL